MKKVIILCVVVTMCFMAVACGESATPNAGRGEGNNETTVPSPTSSGDVASTPAASGDPANSPETSDDPSGGNDDPSGGSDDPSGGNDDPSGGQSIDYAVLSRLSNDWKDFEFYLDGEIFSLPMSRDVFEASGWRKEPRDLVPDRLLENEFHRISYEMQRGNSWVDIRMSSLDGSPVESAVAPIVGVSSSDYGIIQFFTVLILPQGITYGSTYDEAILAYGPPNIEDTDRMSWFDDADGMMQLVFMEGWDQGVTGIYLWYM